MNTISIKYLTWLRLIVGLKVRGKGVRESGGFMLGKPNEQHVHSIVFYDQFDPNVSDSGYIQFKGAVSFYEYLAKHNLQVLADIHTHPSKNTSQSESDRTHPMIKLKGHIAIIAPCFANNPFILPKQCSVYKYKGNFNWEKYENSELPFKLKLY